MPIKLRWQVQFLTFYTSIHQQDVMHANQTTPNTNHIHSPQAKFTWDMVCCTSFCSVACGLSFILQACQITRLTCQMQSVIEKPDFWPCYTDMLLMSLKSHFFRQTMKQKIKLVSHLSKLQLSLSSHCDLLYFMPVISCPRLPTSTEQMNHRTDIKLRISMG